MQTIQAIPAFTDNYIWLLITPDNARAICIDPGDAAPVLDVLKKQALTLDAILITHHHHDHTGGVTALQRAFPNAYTYWPADLHDNQQFTQQGSDFTVLTIPGHTLDHIAYYTPGHLFCGDTLFAAGCGRLFEGSAEQMLHSLERISALPDDTLCYPAHEYTLNNLRFARIVEPENQAIQERLTAVIAQREQGEITLPCTLALEKATNPFLRCHKNTVIQAAKQHSGREVTDIVDVFAVIRTWKDLF